MFMNKMCSHISQLEGNSINQSVSYYVGRYSHYIDHISPSLVHPHSLSVVAVDCYLGIDKTQLIDQFKEWQSLFSLLWCGGFGSGRTYKHTPWCSGYHACCMSESSQFCPGGVQMNGQSLLIPAPVNPPVAWCQQLCTWCQLGDYAPPPRFGGG